MIRVSLLITCLLLSGCFLKNVDFSDMATTAGSAGVAAVTTTVLPSLGAAGVAGSAVVGGLAGAALVGESKSLSAETIKEEGRIRRARQEAIYKKEEQNRMIRDYTIMGIAALIGLSAVGWMVWLISMSV